MKKYLLEHIENIPLGFLLLKVVKSKKSNENYKVIDFNSYFEEIIGTTFENINTEKKISSIKEFKNINKLIQKMIDGSNIKEEKLYFSTISNSWYNVKVKKKDSKLILWFFPINTNDALKIIQGSYKDINQEIIDKSKQKYKALFDFANDAIFIMKNMKFIDCNKKTLELFDCKRKDIIGKKLFKFLPEKQLNGRISNKLVKRTINKTLKGEPQKLILKLKTYKNQIFDAELRTSTYRIEDRQFLIAIVRDISKIKKVEADIKDRIKIEKQLRKSKRRFKNLANLLPQSVWEADKKGNFTYINKFGLDLFGYSQKDFEDGLSVQDVIAKKDIKRGMNNFKKIFNQKKYEYNKSYYEYTCVKKNGKKFPAMIYSSPINEGDKVVGVRGIIVDITESGPLGHNDL